MVFVDGRETRHFICTNDVEFAWGKLSSQQNGGPLLKDSFVQVGDTQEVVQIGLSKCLMYE